MIHPLTTFKEEQKKLAREIRFCKKQRDENFRAGKCVIAQAFWGDAEDLARTYRHNHIAYCQVRGRKREDIEKPRKGNEPDEGWIEDIQEELEEALTKYHEARKSFTIGEPNTYEEIAEVS